MRGRIAGADEVTVTRTELITGKNADRYALALVSVSPDGPVGDQVRYVERPYDGLEPSFETTRVNLDWRKLWSRGVPPVPLAEELG